MAQKIIEATSAAQRDEYKKTAEYAEYIAGATHVTEGVTLSVQKEGVTGEEPNDTYWVLIENDSDEDNVTLRVNENGTAEFWATGVEI